VYKWTVKETRKKHSYFGGRTLRSSEFAAIPESNLMGVSADGKGEMYGAA